MSGTTEWRQLANTYGLPAKQYAEALKAACTRLDEQANLLGIANEKWGQAVARAEAAEAKLAAKITATWPEAAADLAQWKSRAQHAEARARELQAEVVKVSSLEHLAQAEREYFAKRAYEAEGKVMAAGVNADLLHQIEKTEAELARVTAKAAVMRESLDTYAQYHENGETALVSGFLAKRALSSTSAGAGLLTSPRSTPSYEAP